MAGDKRVTYTRRHAYATASNKIKVVRTPGGKHVAHYRKKKANGPKCGDCKIALPGIACLRPKEYKNLKRREKTVSRAYGGSRCAACVRQRVVRAFLIEEQKIVKKLLAEKIKGKAK
ncbi:ribosomal protein L34e-domain-containing protein [Tribonema minus]|uniref:Ribosomal protein L34e-domain-containing protein n=1 Tax=Tribonema minus TaxID=303371 RepID=A0A835ZPJ0_9STRA|nr:ribosomal protein L34e-domain-containing protein [Tribonema minus]|eukprot:TRINITY_DN29090_c0_g1_i1.p2 TRINITY_DN29090_c0_g1~~TRINITY_DN29090_c0_g1_i1.p2  ORF type:complete len:133 (-),score=50.60 TRINITY_DN29090_c0_g1_i1:53-403(-)